MKWIFWGIISFGLAFSLSAQEHLCNKIHSFQNEDIFRSASMLDDPNIDLISYKFDWFIDPNKLFIEGSAEVLFKSTENNLYDIVLNLSTKLKVDSVVANGVKLTFKHDNNFDLNIILPKVISKGETSKFTIYYNGTPPSNGFGSYTQSSHAGEKILWTFSVPFGSRDWWPCKNGNEDKIDTVEINITCPKKYQAASNGKLIAINPVDDNNHTFIWKHSYPIVPYLIAFAVTNYTYHKEVVEFHDKTKMDVDNFIYPETINSGKAGVKNFLKSLVFYDSLLVRYPFINDKYGHAQFGWSGGMEHQTISFVNNYSFGLLAHELAHQWFGDMVTCKSWSDCWLNEGFATYMEGMAQEKYFPSIWQNWKQTKLANITSSGAGTVFVKDSTNINRIFDNRLVYDKGAFLLHQLRWILGDDIFVKGLKNYLGKYKYSHATTADFQRSMEEVSAVPLTEYFNDYFYGEGYPKYDVKWQAQPNNKVALRINQTQQGNKVSFFEMPIEIRCSNGSQSQLVRLEMNANNQYYEVDLPFECMNVEFDPNIWLISRFNTVTKTTVSSSEEFIENSITLFPNPTSDFLQIESSIDLSKTKYYISNSVGLILLKGNLTLSQIDVSNLLEGYYHIEFKNQKDQGIFQSNFLILR